MKKDEFKENIRVWRLFGQKLQIDETRFRGELSAEWGLAVHGLLGCSWMRCPLYQCLDSPLEREMMRCSKCRRVSGLDPRVSTSAEHA